MELGQSLRPIPGISSVSDATIDGNMIGIDGTPSTINPCSYGPLPVISTYSPIYNMYNPTYNQL